MLLLIGKEEVLLVSFLNLSNIVAIYVQSQVVMDNNFIAKNQRLSVVSTMFHLQIESAEIAYPIQ
ncbi:hypothetical protein [Candidatus Gullanella endobia]|uniref:hypothetical protein n=1 Tax=Candidatus Gullanella endobia TaxID=1070130 RepID=UPI00082C7B18|nr:hypothetical protein [Candidatus Gullanella endobia]